jgi:hypothetical protein
MFDMDWQISRMLMDFIWDFFNFFTYRFVGKLIIDVM